MWNKLEIQALQIVKPWNGSVSLVTFAICTFNSQNGLTMLTPKFSQQNLMHLENQIKSSQNGSNHSWKTEDNSVPLENTISKPPYPPIKPSSAECCRVWFSDQCSFWHISTICRRLYWTRVFSCSLMIRPSFLGTKTPRIWKF